MIVTFFLPQTAKGGRRVPGTLPLRHDTCWAGFVAYLRESAMVPTPRWHKEVPTVEVIAIGMAIYPDDAKRSKNAAIGADWIGLDIDDKGDVEDAWKFDALVEFLDGQGIAYALYTTTSCTEERHCLRLILPFNRRVDELEWDEVWSAFSAWIGQVDAKTKDISRILYEPRQWEGAFNRFHASATDLPFVDVRDIKDRYLPPSPEPIISPSRPQVPRVKSVEFSGDLMDFDTSPIIRPEWVEEATMSQRGGRMFRFLCRVALSARAKGIDLHVSDLQAIGENLARILWRSDNSDIRRDADRALSWASTVSLDTREPRLSPRLPPWPWS